MLSLLPVVGAIANLFSIKNGCWLWNVWFAVCRWNSALQPFLSFSFIYWAELHLTGESITGKIRTVPGCGCVARGMRSQSQCWWWCEWGSTGWLTKLPGLLSTAGSPSTGKYQQNVWEYPVVNAEPSPGAGSAHPCCSQVAALGLVLWFHHQQQSQQPQHVANPSLNAIPFLFASALAKTCSQVVVCGNLLGHRICWTTEQQERYKESQEITSLNKFEIDCIKIKSDCLN